MRALRFLFLTVHGSARPDDGLPADEAQAFATAWIIPPPFALGSAFLPEQALAALLDAPSRAKASEVAVGLWSAQQRLCGSLADLGVDARGLPPVNGRALEAFFLPAGRFWLGAYCPATSLPASREALARALGALFGSPPRRAPVASFPWLGEFSRSSAWALGASQAFGEEVDFAPAPTPR